MALPPAEEPRLPPRPETECPACGHIAQHKVTPGTPPHAWRLGCEKCSHFLKWLPKFDRWTRINEH